MKRLSHARQLAMKSLFAMSLAGTDVDETLAFLQEEEAVSKETVKIARELARGAFDRVEQLDRIIESHLLRWDFSRIGNVEKAILRLAVFELLHRPDTPRKVVLNEALELGKEFTTRQSVRFLNGVLDKIARPTRSTDGTDEKPAIPPSDHRPGDGGS